MAFPPYLTRRSLQGIMLIISTLVVVSFRALAQGSITYNCSALNLSGTSPLKCDPVSEDDPNDLAECYSYLICFMPGDEQRFELRFPARKAVYNWTQSGEDDKNDSLSAYFLYHIKTGSDEIKAYPRSFTINVNRYDGAKGGTVAGTFKGTMEAYMASSQTTVTISISGNFQAIRTGKFGAECRKARQSENALFEHAKDIMRSGLIEPLQKMGWQVQDNQNLKTMIANHPVPYKPLSLCNNIFDLKLTLDPNTPYGKMLADSAAFYANQGTPQASLKMFRIQDMQRVEIQVIDNDPYIKSEFSHGPADKYSILHVPGTAFACRFYSAPQSEVDSPQVSTCLFFGNWSGADMNAATYVKYPFIHKHPGPYLETLNIKIIGPASAADHIIKQVDWNALNAALTK
jgi:hypothetical protein